MAFQRRPHSFSPRLGGEAEPSSRAEGTSQGESLGKAKPFRTSGGRAPLGCCLLGTLTRPYALLHPERPRLALKTESLERSFAAGYIAA